MEFSHIPVLLEDCLEGLDIKPNGIYVDCTVGGAGHSLRIAQKLGENGRLIGLDRDPDAVATATERLKDYPATVVQSNYSDIRKVLKSLDINSVDGILMDLGVSSYQLDNSERGFSYHTDAPLDMRMSKSGMTAADFLNNSSEKTIADTLFYYGEEKFSKRIAQKIVEYRQNKKIETTLEFADLIRAGIPQKARRDKNPCKKSFQAVRIAVNGEFEHLEKGLKEAFMSLKTGGRLAVITFHSLEDRIVKQHFVKWNTGCICPKNFPVCVCNKKPLGNIINKKPITATDEELEKNVRSRSAKLRVIQRTDEPIKSIIDLDIV
jgi:16S rRNA (cytosine1402-N4)-methyltransferase